MTRFTPRNWNTPMHNPSDPPGLDGRRSSPPLIINEIVVPTVRVEGRTWLSASPLCRALGLKVDARHRAGQHIARLPEAERGHRLMPVRGVLQRCAVVTAEGAVQLAATGRRRGAGAYRKELEAMIDEIVSGPAA